MFWVNMFACRVAEYLVIGNARNSQIKRCVIGAQSTYIGEATRPPMVGQDAPGPSLSYGSHVPDSITCQFSVRREHKPRVRPALRIGGAVTIFLHLTDISLL